MSNVYNIYCKIALLRVEKHDHAFFIKEHFTSRRHRTWITLKWKKAGDHERSKQITRLRMHLHVLLIFHLKPYGSAIVISD